MCGDGNLVYDLSHPSKFFIEFFTIEVTRQCQLRCSHCLRGDPQDVSIQPHAIDQFLSKVQGIRNISITGGEPALAIKELRYLLTELVERGIEYHNFYLVTNGQVASEEFVNVCYGFRDHALCSTQVMISNDTYHQRPPRKNIKYLTSNAHFIKCGQTTDLECDELIAEGRAKDIGMVRIEPGPVDIDNYHIGSLISLNALGEVLSAARISYETQSKKQFTICQASDFGYDTIEHYNHSFIN